MIWFFKELLRQDATGLVIAGILVLILIWIFLVPVIRVRVHWVRRLMLGAISMILGIGVLIFSGMSMGSVHGVGDNTRNAVIFIAAIVLICLPFLVSAIARRVYGCGASSDHSHKDF